MSISKSEHSSCRSSDACADMDAAQSAKASNVDEETLTSQCRGWRGLLLLMDKILHYFTYPKLWELWYIPYNG